MRLLAEILSISALVRPNPPGWVPTEIALVTTRGASVSVPADIVVVPVAGGPTVRLSDLMVLLPKLVNPLTPSTVGPIASAPVVVKLKVPLADPARVPTLLFSVNKAELVCTLRLGAVIVLPVVCVILLPATSASAVAVAGATGWVMLRFEVAIAVEPRMGVVSPIWSTVVGRRLPIAAEVSPMDNRSKVELLRPATVRRPLLFTGAAKLEVLNLSATLDEPMNAAGPGALMVPELSVNVPGVEIEASAGLVSTKEPVPEVPRSTERVESRTLSVTFAPDRLGPPLSMNVSELRTRLPVVARPAPDRTSIVPPVFVVRVTGFAPKLLIAVVTSMAGVLRLPN